MKSALDPEVLEKLPRLATAVGDLTNKAEELQESLETVARICILNKIDCDPISEMLNERFNITV